MRILLITNLYPPQELGGYGRSMADFAWGLKELGHEISVLCSNAPYLDIDSIKKDHTINRNLLLKGSFENGITNITDPLKRSEIDKHNIKLLEVTLSQGNWNGILIGNIDLIGEEILETLAQKSIPILHHIGFMEPSFSYLNIPKTKNYIMLAASNAVRISLKEKGFKVDENSVVYPGARVELFGDNATKRNLPALPDGTQRKPLCIAFAGLLMSSKGLHTLVESLAILRNKEIFTRTYIAGTNFQTGYKEALEEFLKKHRLLDSVNFLGSLKRDQLARFFRLNHVFVFPSIYPEAFGIVQAEAMASGLPLISSGVGGSKELVKQDINGWLFRQQDSDDLSNKLAQLAKNPELIKKFGINSNNIARKEFSTIASSKKIEAIFKEVRGISENR